MIVLAIFDIIVILLSLSRFLVFVICMYVCMYWCVSVHLENAALAQSMKHDLCVNTGDIPPAS